jgi:hypothetical protein
MNEEILKMDGIMKTMFQLSAKLLIYLVEAVFDHHFDPKETTVDLGNTELSGLAFSAIRGDLFVTLTDKTKSITYQFEFQTDYDGKMSIRLMDYGMRKAIADTRKRFKAADRKSRNKTLLFEFPRQTVIFLEHDARIGDTLPVQIKLPDGQIVGYDVPVMKYWEYTAAELKKQKLYILLPLQVFKVRARMREIKKEKGSAAAKRLLFNAEFKNLIDDTSKTLAVLGDLYNANEIASDDLQMMLEAMTSLSGYIYEHFADYSDTNKEMNKMVKKLFDPVIWNDGKIEGEKKGKRDGKLEEGKNILLLQLRRKLEDVPPEIIRKIKEIKTLKTIENLSLHIFDIDGPYDVNLYLD